jgi:hypothetical protein
MSLFIFFPSMVWAVNIKMNSGLNIEAWGPLKHWHLFARINSITSWVSWTPIVIQCYFSAAWNESHTVTCQWIWMGDLRLLPPCQDLRSPVILCSVDRYLATEERRTNLCGWVFVCSCMHISFYWVSPIHFLSQVVIVSKQKRM